MQKRTITNNVSLNRDRFDTAMRRKKYTFTSLNTQSNGTINEGVLRRARKNESIDSDTLRKLAKCLEVDSAWLSGQELLPFPKSNQIDTSSSHPTYPSNQALDQDSYLRAILYYHGITSRQFNQLSPKKRHALYQELDAVLKMIIFKYFTPIVNQKEFPLLDQEFYSLSCEVLSGPSYEKILKLNQKQTGTI